jgi:hypothetical protein
MEVSLGSGAAQMAATKCWFGCSKPGDESLACCTWVTLLGSVVLALMWEEKLGQCPPRPRTAPPPLQH